VTKEYSIGELAAEFDISTRTIRFYEEKNLLTPTRRGTRRTYSQADHTRLKLILRGKRIGLSLDESAEIIQMYGLPGNNKKQLELLIDKVRLKRADLLHQQQDLEIMLLDLKDVEDKCLEALTDLANETPK
jgi:DNA-binding transcriptional MerR regulator